MQPGPDNKDLPLAKLMASFQPSLAFYIGHILNPTAAKEYVELSDIWQKAAEGFSRHAYVACLMSDEASCSEIAALTPTEVLNLDAHEVQQNLRAEMLASIREPVAVVMLFVRCIRTAAIEAGHQVGLTPDHTLEATLNKLHLQRASLSLAQGTFNTPRITPLSPHIASLRSAILILKAAILSPELHGNPPKPYSAKRSLWNTAQGICKQVQASAIQARDQLGTMQLEPDTPLLDDIKQACHMSCLIIQLITPVLHQHLKGWDHADLQTKEYMLVTCCTIMGSMSTATNSPVLRMLSHTVADEIANEGVPFLTNKRLSLQFACFFSDMLYDDQHLSLLYDVWVDDGTIVFCQQHSMHFS